MSGNSVSTKESKESRFRIVKTDSAKKAENLSGGAGNQQIGQINANDNYTNSNNQTPTLPNRGQNPVTTGQNGKSYHRGRWHVMDFETAPTETQPSVATIPPQLSQQQQAVQVTPKLNSLKNMEQPKYDDSTPTNVHYTGGRILKRFRIVFEKQF